MTKFPEVLTDRLPSRRYSLRRHEPAPATTTRFDHVSDAEARCPGTPSRASSFQPPPWIRVGPQR